MTRALTIGTSLLLAALLLAAGCRSGGGSTSSADAQRRFGVKMAKMNLWREAMFRFRRAAEIEPDDAMTHNNLAVACEANGDFDTAAKEYREAMRLDRSNQYIQKNYSRFVEFTSKSRKREVKPPPPAAVVTPAPVTPPPAPATPPGAAVPPVTDTNPPAAPPVVPPPAPVNPPAEGGAR